MKPGSNHQKYKELRHIFPYFTYESFSYFLKDDEIFITFRFDLCDDYIFMPSLRIPIKSFFVKENINEDILRNIIFHIGMIELISYWKAACPPRIIVKPFHLTDDQIKWWKKLYFKGLGEFFYRNSIKTNIDEFVQIESEGIDEILPARFKTEDKTIVPIGGGKDSIASLKMLQNAGKKVTPMILNPRGASLSTIEQAGFTEDHIIDFYRTIHPRLLEFNGNGFLNGHTPFSALLAFMTLFAGALTGTKNIALSNENSANESTVKNSHVNHQYSKSWEFEYDFRQYASKYISPDFNYFSFLRPLNELQIASIFSKQKDFYKIFKSCNEGSKQDIWCSNCSKCLFTFIMMAPFIPQDELIEIFNKNLLNDPNLLKDFKKLTGQGNVKPFECVGTVEEVKASLDHILLHQPEYTDCCLMQQYKNARDGEGGPNNHFQELLNSYNGMHALEKDFRKIIRSNIRKTSS
ncbi:MAG: hypothetical protein ACEPOW_01385 [Bacteroidales bacterium]